MNREQIRRKPNQGQMKERYNQLYQKFVNTEYTYSSHTLLKKLCENGSREPNLYAVPLYKILLQITKIMMMNELQILFLGSTLQEMKWKITEACLNDYYEEITDFTPKINKEPYAKKIQLALLLIAYIVKIYTNEDVTLIDFKIREIVRNNFDKMYQIWVQKVQSNFKFNPKNMNKLFKEIDQTKKDNKVEIVDYNQLVSDFFKNTEQPMQAVEKEVERKEMNREYIGKDYLDYRKEENREYQDELPLEEEEENINLSNKISRLPRNNSEIGMARRDSANEFLTPHSQNPFKLLLRNNSLDSNH